jgi:hypothetical protein
METSADISSPTTDALSLTFSANPEGSRKFTISFGIFVDDEPVWLFDKVLSQSGAKSRKTIVIDVGYYAAIQYFAYCPMGYLQQAGTITMGGMNAYGTVHINETKNAVIPSNNVYGTTYKAYTFTTDGDGKVTSLIEDAFSIDMNIDQVVGIICVYE